MDVVNAIDPFVMQYTDGFPINQVGWGRFTLETLSQQTRIATLQIAISMRTPYLAEIQSSNAGQHVLRSLKQAKTGVAINGAFGDPQSQVIVVISSDYYLAGLAALLNLHWQLPGYEPDFCAPGGALVFELRQEKTTEQYIVRVFYTAQTFDQLRKLTALNLETPPGTQQLKVPNGSISDTNLDVNFDTFDQLLNYAIDSNSVQTAVQEIPPCVLNPYISTTPPNLIISTAKSNQLTLSWPTEHRGWILQEQTKNLGFGTWVDQPGTAQINSIPITANPDNSAGFYRLHLP